MTSTTGNSWLAVLLTSILMAACGPMSLGTDLVARGAEPPEAEQPVDTEPATPDDIAQDQPENLVRVAVDREDYRYRYREGESLSVRIISEEDAYAYVVVSAGRRQALSDSSELDAAKQSPGSEAGTCHPCRR